MNPVVLISRKEAGELLLSPRGLGWILAVAVALSVFALLLVSNTELSLLDNAQIVYDMAAIVSALGGLLALMTGIESVAGERERGSLVLLLLAPHPRGSILAGKLIGCAAAWGVIYLLSLPYLWAVGSTGQNLIASLVVLALFGTPVVIGFGFLGLALGAWLRTTRAAHLSGLIGLIVAASPLLLGPSLRQSAIGRAFDAVNPFSSAVNAYDAVIIDSAPLSAQWPHAATVLLWLALLLALATAGFRRLSR